MHVSRKNIEIQKEKIEKTNRILIHNLYNISHAYISLTFITSEIIFFAFSCTHFAMCTKMQQGFCSLFFF